MATILVIDDEVSMRTSIQKMLEREGYNVLTAVDGNEGMKLFNNNQVALVITDIVMPEKEGIGTIMEMKASSQDVKIIAISGGGLQGPEDYLEIAKSFGAKYVLKKPFKRDDLMNAVNWLLEEGDIS